jgi:Mn2+/Fe2+ NRAMP family transporter
VRTDADRWGIPSTESRPLFARLAAVVVALLSAACLLPAEAAAVRGQDRRLPPAQWEFWREFTTEVAALGLLGTTVSPYMLFWQADEEAEELHRGTTSQATNETATVWIGMIYSNLIALFVIVAAATTIHRGGGQITSVADAARALSPLGRLSAGNTNYWCAAWYPFTLLLPDLTKDR